MTQPERVEELPRGHRVGRYTVVRTLGRGGMGVVYVACDDRLQREVALKMIAGLPDATSVHRFWREARAAASVNHPNVCQIFEVDESSDGIYLAMELLEGETLDVRLSRGALDPAEVVAIARGVLAALGALHERGLVHRDVKPSNVYLSAHGPKLLDFGLARTVARQADADSRANTTQEGMAIGTPRYMSPEQISAGEVDHRTDLYSLGSVVFEMLAGHPPFQGAALVDIMYATLHERPPALQGPPEVIAIDRVIRRALEKDPAHRYPTAAAMSDALGAIPFGAHATGARVAVRAFTRIVVPPLRLARPDPDIAFLSFGLAEAVSASLASVSDVVVRASSTAARWADTQVDPRQLATDADVDVVLAGTLLRSGAQLRATVQLIDAVSGTVHGARNVTGAIDDIFSFEDQLARTAEDLLGAYRVPRGAAPVTPPATPADVPASARAFELFLRGVEHARTLDHVVAARDMLLEAVREDPVFAPAWAALGRCHRVIGKYVEAREVNERLAEDAIRRALALAPHLPVAHRYLTHLEAEHGRADAAIARLLEHAKVNRKDAQLFAGLVHACRYAGLVDESLAAHHEARRLDPTVPTSAEYTFLQTTESVDDFAHIAPEIRASTDPDVTLVMMVMFGEDARARDHAERLDLSAIPTVYRQTMDAVVSVVRDDHATALARVDAGIRALADPEAHFLYALALIRLGERERVLALLASIVAAGFTPLRMFERHRVFAEYRALPEFTAITDDARRRVRTARAVFERGGGAALLGLGV